MTDKQQVLAVVADMPEGASVEQIAEEIDILAAIRRGEEAADQGRVVPLEEVKGLLRSWLKK